MIRDVAVCGTAGIGGGYLVTTVLNSGGARFLMEPDVVGAAIGAALTIGGTLFIQHAWDWHRSREAKRRVKALAEALLISLNDLGKSQNGDEMFTNYQAANLQKVALDKLQRLNPTESPATMVMMVALDRSWNANFGPLDEMQKVFEDGPEGDFGKAALVKVAMLRATLASYINTFR